MQPKLSVIIPIRSGTLPSDTALGLSQACRDFSLIEVIVVEGNALSRQRNEAVARASAPLIYFIDDDSCLDSDGLKEGLKHFANHDVDVVGGPATTRVDAAFIERCFGEVVSVPLGAWRMRARNTPTGPPRPVDGEELIFCNLMMRKSHFDAASGMDEGLYPGEDVDLIRRLRCNGAKMFYNPEMKVIRPRRRALGEFSKQYFAYARGRGERIHQNFRSKDVVFILPSIFAVYLLSLLIVCNAFTLIPLMIYAFLCMINGILIALRTGSIATGFVSTFLFLPLHLAYGTGMATGISKSFFRRMNRPVPVRNVRVIELAYGEGLN